MKQAIQKAIEGGYDDMLDASYHKPEAEVLNDLKFWQGLGVSLRWPEWRCQCGQYYVGTDKRFKLPQGKRPKVCGNCDRSARTIKPSWLANWHRFIDHLAEGRQVDEFFNDLLK